MILRRSSARKPHQVDHVLGFAGEFLAQFRILGGDADRTGIQMAHPHHHAAQGDKGDRGETELLGTQQAGDGHVACRFSAGRRTPRTTRLRRSLSTRV